MIKRESLLTNMQVHLFM